MASMNTESFSAYIGLIPTLVATVPTVTGGATLVSLNVSNTGQTGTNVIGNFFRRRSGVPDKKLGSTANIALNSSANIMPAKEVLITGDQIYGNIDVPNGGSASPFGDNTIVAGNGTITGTLLAVMVNTAGTTICAVYTKGIWRSTDGGNSWTKMYSPATGVLTAEKPWASIFSTTSKFYFYTSATTAVVSTDDGQTWTPGVAVTNAPQVLFNSFGSVIKNGSTFVGQNSNTRLTSSTDCVTWTLATAFPGSDTGVAVVFDGTEFVVSSGSQGTNNAAYYRTTSANLAGAWSTATLTGSGQTGFVGSGSCSRGMVSNGAGIILAFDNSNSSNYLRSTDHGATWTPSQLPNNHSGNALVCGWTGSVFFCGPPGGSITIVSLSNLGDSQNWAYYSSSGTGGTLSYYNVLISGNRIVKGSAIDYILGRSADLLLTPTYGMNATVSLAEYTA